MPHWLLHFLGLDSASGTAYLWWSGAGSDLAELAIVGGLISVYRRHNCEVARCWRLGRHDTAAGHTVCRRHMPGGAPTHGDVIEAHAAAQRARRPRRTDPRASGERLQEAGSCETPASDAEQVRAENSAAEIADAQPKTRRSRKATARKEGPK
jgi:hypothetical protein